MNYNDAWNNFKYYPKTGEIFNKTKRMKALKGERAEYRDAAGYLALSFRNKTYRAHRVAWFLYYGVWPKEIDHINQNKADNRIGNIRDVSHQENGKNIKISSLSKTGIMGVCWYEKSNKWRAYITIDQKQKHLGLFDNLLDAGAARKAAENIYQFHKNHNKPNRIAAEAGVQL